MLWLDQPIIIDSALPRELLSKSWVINPVHSSPYSTWLKQRISDYKMVSKAAVKASFQQLSANSQLPESLWQRSKPEARNEGLQLCKNFFNPPPPSLALEVVASFRVEKDPG